MKNYLDFKLSGSKVFPYFLLIFLTAITANIINVFASINPDPLSTFKFVSLGFALVNIVVVFLLLFFIYRLFITAISYKDEVLKFDGSYEEYLKICVKGLLLTIVTFGIYSCWFEKNLLNFYSRSTSHGNIKFKFNGSAVVLFAIITVMVIVICILSVAAVLSIKSHAGYGAIIVLYLTIFTLMIPFLYIIYRWYIDLSYGNKTVKMRDGGYVCGCLYFCGQFLLTIMTLGLYGPAAMIRIYRYFATRIEIRNEEGVLESKMGCDATMGKDFIFVFAQILLSMVTFGIYYPWAMCAISERMITKTYIETI